MKCKYCKGVCTKAGKQKNGILKWYCKTCRKYLYLLKIELMVTQLVSKEFYVKAEDITLENNNKAFK